jgi:hypothetical protein
VKYHVVLISIPFMGKDVENFYLNIKNLQVHGISSDV